MPKLQDLYTDLAVRTNAVTGSLKTMDGNVLFLSAVNQFRKKVNKKKAIAIYDIFLGPNKVWPEIGELDEANRTHAAALHGLKLMITWYAELHAAARSMNAFKRVYTSKSRDVVSPGVFDAIIILSKVESGSVAGFLTDTRDRSQGYGNWQELVTKGKKLLKDAGFDVADLGMSRV